jgi:hypothetical protein
MKSLLGQYSLSSGKIRTKHLPNMTVELYHCSSQSTYLLRDRLSVRKLQHPNRLIDRNEIRYTRRMLTSVE